MNDAAGGSGKRSSFARVHGKGETSAGIRRKENQDSILVLESESLRLYAVADGMGGAFGGAHASRLAIAALEDYARRVRNWNQHSLEEAFLEAHARVRQESIQNEALARMGTTLVCLVVSGSNLYWANVGDSRCYYIHQGKARPLTDDHTVAAELVRSGALPAVKARPGPLSHMLTQSLGGEEGIVVDSWAAPLEAASRDRFLLCSDGLYNMLSDDEIGSLAEFDDPAQATHALVRRANELGADDNVSAIVVDLGLHDHDASSTAAGSIVGRRVPPLYPGRPFTPGTDEHQPLVDTSETPPTHDSPPPAFPSLLKFGPVEGATVILVVFLLGLLVGSTAPQVSWTRLEATSPVAESTFDSPRAGMRSSTGSAEQSGKAAAIARARESYDAARAAYLNEARLLIENPLDPDREAKVDALFEEYRALGRELAQAEQDASVDDR